MTTTLAFNAVPLAKFIRDNIVAAALPLLIANWFNGVSEHLKRFATYFLNTGEADNAARLPTDANQHHALSEQEFHYAA